MIAATNARTAIVLAVGELLLLIFFIIRNRDYFKKSFSIMVISVMAFTFNLVNFNDVLSNKTITINSEESYIKSNLTSVADTTSRSNNARFANLIGNVNTIIEYPLIGTGTGLQDADICRNLPNFSYENPEVRNWILYIHKDGVLKSGGIPSLNKYANVAVQNGVIGLMLYFSVVAYLSFNLVKNWTIIKNDYRAILLIIAMLGLLAAGMSNAGFVICNGIVWGLLYCKLKELDKLEDTL